MFSRRIVLAIALTIGLPACSFFSGIRNYWHHTFNVNGAIPTVNNNSDRFGQVDLVKELTAGPPLPDTQVPRLGVECEQDSGDPETARACLAHAFTLFYATNWDSVYGKKDETSKVGVATGAAACSTYADRELGGIERARNAIQDRLLAASESACSEFEQQLNTFQSDSNFLLGVMSIATGGAGAIVTSATAARALAGSAAGISGVRAEWNTDLFAKLLVSTITKAINAKRDDWMETLRGSCVSPAGEEGSLASMTGQATGTPTATPTSGGHTPAVKGAGQKPKNETPTATATPEGKGTSGGEDKTFKIGKQQLSIQVYSVQAAVGDALIYNDLCSLDRGLEFVNASVDTAANPGLDAMKSYLDKLKDVNQSLAGAFKAVQPASSATATPGGAANDDGAGNKPKGGGKGGGKARKNS